MHRLAFAAVLLSLAARAETAAEILAGGAKSRASLERQCSKDQLDACSNLGVFYERGIGGEQSDARAVELFRRACDGKVASGCYNLGTRYQKGRGATRDWAKALQFFETACNSGHAKACGSAGDLLDQGGNGIERDTKRSTDLYRGSCDKGHLNGCYNLGTSYLTGEGAEKDAPRALSLFEKACTGKPEPVAAGCNNAGHMLMRGDGVPKDESKGASYLSQMCTKAQGPDEDKATKRSGILACVTAAGYYEKDAAQKSKAKLLYLGGCSLGHAPACESAKKVDLK